MGLLDEAIREHLELKRRSGADPSAVAREEREALMPVTSDTEANGQEAHGHDDGEAAYASVPVTEVDQPSRGKPDEHPAADFSSVGQETAELDMSTVLDAHVDVLGAATVTYGGQHGDGREQEMPEAHAQGPQPELPGQERLSFD
jgi:hypothetical protein